MFEITVGIMSEPQIRFSLHAPYHFDSQTLTGEQNATIQDHRILLNGQLYDEINLIGAADATFTLCDVTIGVKFHWERKENQTFRGNLRLIVENEANNHFLAGKGEVITAINCLDVEDYLTSVISSEMAATSSMELLKAHAIISRSWLLAPITSPNPSQGGELHKKNHPLPLGKGDRGKGPHIKIYERDAHFNFHVCADDHCQRYEGITRQTAAQGSVEAAINATRGIVLMSEGEVCDARFYKCCGGATELFSTCWADHDYPYLQAVRDQKNEPLPDLTIEANAEAWIRSCPKAYCNTRDARLLSQVLNNYDQETQDFYRWTVRYTTAELSALVKEKSGIDFGDIQALIPVRRGGSGRLIELKIVGSKREMVIGKELEIRKWLSPSHLYSSAFVVDKTKDGFLLTGAGWGHGVGLCQIGAAVMADQGFTYQEILEHYFPTAQLKTL